MGRFVAVLVGFGLSALLIGGFAAEARAATTVDFEGLAEGAIVSTLTCAAGVSCDTPIGGSISIFGFNPVFGAGVNTAMIFDATCTGGCTGGDTDLFQPGQGNVLITSEDLDGSDPDDADVPGMQFDLNFAGFGSGTVTVNSLVILDVDEGEEGGTIQLFSGGPGGTLLATIAIPVTGDGSLATIPIGVSGVDFLRVNLNGSAAIDGIDLQLDLPPNGDQGCTPGYWKNLRKHLAAWTAAGFAPGDDFDTVFGVNAFTPDITLEQALNLGGGGLNKLARHAVAALLSAAHPDVNYPLTLAQVIALVQSAISDPEPEATQLDTFNNLGCPLNGGNGGNGGNED